MNSPVLSVDNLNVVFHQDGKTAHIVHDVSFKVHAGRCLGILGESGSGKSMSCKAVLRLLDKNFKISGNVRFKGEVMVLIRISSPNPTNKSAECAAAASPWCCKTR